MTDADDRILNDPRALGYGEEAASTVAAGGVPDPARIERFARALEVLRRGIAAGTMSSPWLVPTEEDVRAVRRLIRLVREGAPREALAEPARRVYAITANPGALLGLCGALPWLAGEATRITRGDTTPRPDVVRKVLDDAAAYFERGGYVIGFEPTPEDLVRVRRLREVAGAESGEELAERHRLAKELWARLPQDGLSDAIRRWAMRVGQWPDTE